MTAEVLRAKHLAHLSRSGDEARKPDTDADVSGNAVAEVAGGTASNHCGCTKSVAHEISDQANSPRNQPFRTSSESQLWLLATVAGYLRLRRLHSVARAHALSRTGMPTVSVTPLP